MLPPLEDEVAVQLQRLVDQCRHGNSYCKQVLSLYQLSKVPSYIIIRNKCLLSINTFTVAGRVSVSVLLRPLQELQCSFTEFCREEPRSMLEKLLLLDQPERFRKAQAFVKAQGLAADTVAELVSAAVVHAHLASPQELQPGENRAGLTISYSENIKMGKSSETC